MEMIEWLDATWSREFLFFVENYHQNGTTKYIDIEIWYREQRPELLQNIPGVMGDNGGGREGSKHEAINIGFLIRI